MAMSNFFLYARWLFFPIFIFTQLETALEFFRPQICVSARMKPRWCLQNKKFRSHNWNTIHDHGRPPWTPSVGSISKSNSSWITQGTQKRLKIDRLPAIESPKAAHCETVIFQLSHLVHFQLNHSPAESSTEWIKMIVKFNERWARVSLMKIVCFNLHSAHNIFIKL